MPVKRFKPLVVLVLAAALVLPTLPRAQETGWEEQLAEQVLREYDCEVAFLSQVSERVVNGDQVILAKVHCEDKRSFDAYRSSAFKPFEIHPCENPENRVC
jgi:hypothetical protein